MVKDSAKSYEQLKWERVVAHYAKLKEMFKTFKYESTRNIVKGKLEDYEAEYPQLKD